jgi:hypothetical protein
MFTFSNISLNTPQILNSTKRQLTIAVGGGTVTNPTLNSIPNISDIKTFYKIGDPNIYMLL